MTDEQYIDWLFQQEPCGYDKTPGFRAFLLDAMAAIGERPRAGDVASMHMAYRAGMESAPNWTPDRPTKPGEYWLSLPPKQRTNQRSEIPVVCHPCGGIFGVYDGITGEWLNAVMSLDLDGALWAPRETPADPFQEVVT